MLQSHTADWSSIFFPPCLFVSTGLLAQPFTLKHPPCLIGRMTEFTSSQDFWDADGETHILFVVDSEVHNRQDSSKKRDENLYDHSSSGQGPSQMAFTNRRENDKPTTVANVNADSYHCPSCHSTKENHPIAERAKESNHSQILKDTYGREGNLIMSDDALRAYNLPDHIIPGEIVCFSMP